MEQETIDNKEKVEQKIEDKKKDDDHVVFIGNKPFMSYPTAVVMQFTTQGAKEVVVKARGRFISRAVDVVQVTMNQFLKEQVKLADNGIKIGSGEFKNKEEKTVRVSWIELTLIKI